MNCRDFLTEFEERERLTEAAALHLNSCPDCKKTSSEQTRVWQMIDVLPRVEAPVNFNFRVKARIADSKPADFQPRFFPVLRYVMPLGMIVLFLGLIAFNMNYFSGDKAQQVEVTVSPASIEKEMTASNPSFTNQNILPTVGNESSVASQLNANVVIVKNAQETQIAAVYSKKKQQTKTPRKNTEEIDGGSRDIAVSDPLIKLPRGLEPNRKIEMAPNTNDTKSFTAEEILPFLGIESVLKNGRWQVKAVKQNSLAEHSGVKIGDVIEAIDGEVFNSPIRAKKLEGRILTIVRGAEKIEIALTNQ